MSRSALILEDSKTQARLIIRMLSGLGWLPVHCEDIASATDCLKHMRIHAMFLDIFVGAHNTLEHIDTFRQLGPQMPLVLMTAGSQGEDIDLTLKRARQTGADHVLRKPFNEAAIASILETIGQDAEAGGKRKHVLVIDDSTTVRGFAKGALINGGYRVSEAASMEAAFASIDIAHVDLVLCDVFMPGMGGLMGMSQIKMTWPSVKIISMSAGIPQQVSEHDALEATRRLGVDAQLVKPFRPNDLRDLIAELLPLPSSTDPDAYIIG